MQELYVSRHALQSMIKACGRSQSIERGRELHDIAMKYGWDHDPFIGSMLVDMYGKCGFIVESLDVFDHLERRDVVSWTSLILAYTENGQATQALSCLEKMKTESMIPNSVTYVCSLKACGSIEALHNGREIHFHIVSRGFDSCLIVVSSLVDMYAKCFSCLEAQRVLENLAVVDMISWTTLMGRLVEQGCGEEALGCLEKMQKEGILLDAVTFTCGLKACVDVREIDIGRELHAEIIKEGLETNISVGNTLVDMYAKCGFIDESKDVFSELPFQDVVSWNALMAGYVEHGLCMEVFNCLKKMQQDGILPTPVTFVCILRSCENPNKGCEMHAIVTKYGFESNAFVENALVDMYMKLGLFLDAFKIFNALSIQNAVAWTAVIARYADHELGEEALSSLHKMVSEGVPMDIGSFVCGLNVCAAVKDLDTGFNLHALSLMDACETNASIECSLIKMYIKCDSFVDAVEVFARAPLKSNALWHSLVVSCVEQGVGEETLEFLQIMQVNDASMDVMTFACALKACSNAGALNRGQDLHDMITKQGIERHNILMNTLVDFYAKCGLLVEAQKSFDMLSHRNVVTWTTLMTGYAGKGEYGLVFQLFERMRREGIYPDEVTFLSLLSVCSHSGVVEEGLKTFIAMHESYSFLNADHLNCLVDIFGRAGQLYKASVILENMPFQPKPLAWFTVLGACRKWGDVNLAKNAFQGALNSTGDQTSVFILMLNIYAHAHMWEDVRLVESMREMSYRVL